MDELTISSIVAGADVNGAKTATVTSSWGNLPIDYALAVDGGGLAFLHADLGKLVLPEGMRVSYAGPVWIAAVSAELLATRPS